MAKNGVIIHNRVRWLRVEAEPANGSVYVSRAFSRPRDGAIILAEGRGKTLREAELDMDRHYHRLIAL